MNSDTPGSLLEELGIYVNDDNPHWDAADIQIFGHDQNIRSSLSSDSLSNSPSDSGDSGFSTEPTSTFSVSATAGQYNQLLESPFDIQPVSPASVSKMEDYLMRHSDCYASGSTASSHCGLQNTFDSGFCNNVCYTTDVNQTVNSQFILLTSDNFLSLPVSHTSTFSTAVDSSFLGSPNSSQFRSSNVRKILPKFETKQVHHKMDNETSTVQSSDYEAVHAVENDEYKAKLEKMAKNRQSAHLSRKRKKEYLESIETQLKFALIDNNRLKRENQHMKQTLESLKSENQLMKEKISELSINNASTKSDDLERLRGKRFRILSVDHKNKSSTKSGACLCVTLLVFTLYFGPSWDLFGVRRSMESGYTPVNVSPIDEENFAFNQILRENQKVDHGQEKTSSQNYNNATLNKRVKRFSDGKNGCGAGNESLSHGHVNETETLRLLQEINTWFFEHGDKKFDYQKIFNARNKNRQENKLDESLYAEYFESSAIDDLANNFDDDSKRIRRSNLLLQQRKHYARFKKLYADFAENSKKASARSDSTYNKNSNQMSKDHAKRFRRLKQLKEALNYSNNTMHILPEGYLVLPSKGFNGTTSLKISLVMTVSANESSAMSSQEGDFVSMMQIECQVVNLIHLPKVGITDRLKRRNGPPAAVEVQNFVKVKQPIKIDKHDNRNATANFKIRAVNESLGK